MTINYNYSTPESMRRRFLSRNIVQGFDRFNPLSPSSPGTPPTPPPSSPASNVSTPRMHNMSPVTRRQQRYFQSADDDFFRRAHERRQRRRQRDLRRHRQQQKQKQHASANDDGGDDEVDLREDKDEEKTTAPSSVLTPIRCLNTNGTVICEEDVTRSKAQSLSDAVRLQLQEHFTGGEDVTVVFCIRRAGCGSCREHALQLSEMARTTENINVFGILKETNVEDDALEVFHRKYFHFPLYRDDGEWSIFKNLLGDRKLTVWRMFQKAPALARRYSRKGIENIPFGGDLWTKGGILIFDRTGTLRFVYYEQYGDELDEMAIRWGIEQARKVTEGTAATTCAASASASAGEAPKQPQREMKPSGSCHTAASFSSSAVSLSCPASEKDSDECFDSGKSTTSNPLCTNRGPAINSRVVAHNYDDFDAASKSSLHSSSSKAANDTKPKLPSRGGQRWNNSSSSASLRNNKKPSYPIRHTTPVVERNDSLSLLRSLSSKLSVKQ